MAGAEKSANAIGGKTARACDSCLRRRARWYCAADDAFLCQSCDSSVHSANQLARRHDRVRLETASSSKGSSDLTNPKFADNTVPAWHHGFTRKARTPRNKKTEPKLLPVDLVPEISNEFDTVMDDNELEEHFFFRVPEFDPFEEVAAAGTEDGSGDFMITGYDLDINELFLPTELDLAGLAADVESLLGKVDDEAVKVKGEVELEEEGDLLSFGIVAAREEAEGAWGGMENRLPLLEEDEKKDIMEEENSEVKKKKKMLLRLSYEDVMAAWDCQGSPWTTGVRPDLGTGDSWPDCMETFGSDVGRSPYREAVGLIRALQVQSGGDSSKGRREERVSRYREKRRTRMFSKKIRYQVRKLNAEKRPRMKGRFVKRSTHSSSYPPITSHP